MIDAEHQILPTADLRPVDRRIVHYAPGSPAFDRLVSRVTQGGTHYIQDADRDALQDARACVNDWLERFTASLKGLRVVSVFRLLRWHSS